jgi:hypothetical protein
MCVRDGERSSQRTAAPSGAKGHSWSREPTRTARSPHVHRREPTCATRCGQPGCEPKRNGSQGERLRRHRGTRRRAMQPPRWMSIRHQGAEASGRARGGPQLLRERRRVRGRAVDWSPNGTRGERPSQRRTTPPRESWRARDRAANRSPTGAEASGRARGEPPLRESWRARGRAANRSPTGAEASRRARGAHHHSSGSGGEPEADPQTGAPTGAEASGRSQRRTAAPPGAVASPRQTCRPEPPREPRRAAEPEADCSSSGSGGEPEAEPQTGAPTGVERLPPGDVDQAPRS